LSDFFVGVCPTKLRRYINIKGATLNREGYYQDECIIGWNIKKAESAGMR
jgi:hypothetical protein